MKIKALSIIIILTLIFTLNTNVFAAASNDYSNKLKQVQDNKNQLQVKVQALDAEVTDVLKKVDNNKKDMNKIASDISNSQSRLDDTKEKLSTDQILLDKRMRAMYTDGNSSYLEVLLGSNSLSDFISKMDITAKIIQYDNNIINNVKQQQVVVTLQRKNLDADNKNLQALKSNNESSLAKLSSAVSDQKKLLSTATAQEQQLIEAERQKELAQAQAVAAQKAKEIAAENAQNVAAQNLAAQNAKDAVAENTSLMASPGSTSSTPSSPNSSSKVYTMTATSYSDYGYTASNTLTHRNPAGYSTIAVDPTVIPLGTKVYVSGYGYAIAEDTGSAIQGNIIDVYLPTAAAANAWGRQTVTVTIVN